MTKEEKNKKLDQVIKDINKAHGEGSVMRLSDESILKDVEVISTGSFSLDIALGVGGFPKGRIVEIFGEESSFKTSLAMHTIAEAQRVGGTCVLIDMEHSYSKVYSEALGVDSEKLYVAQPSQGGEEALEIADELIKTGAIDVMVIDSVAALVPKAELNAEMGSSHMGLHARLMSQALRKITASVHKSNTLVIFLNQIRNKIGVMYGPNTTTTGGKALQFYASVRLHTTALSAKIEDADKNPIGNRIKVKIVKNKVAPPFKVIEFDNIFGKGIDKVGDLLDIATHLEIVNKAGAWYSYNGEQLGQGRDKTKVLLADNEELMEEIREKVKNYRL